MFSSWSEICLRVIKACSTSILLFCLLCISTSLSLFRTHTHRHTQSVLHQQGKWCTFAGEKETSLTALWAGPTVWFCSHGWQSRFFPGCPAAPPSQGAEQAAAGFVWDLTCPETPETPNQAARHKQNILKGSTSRMVKMSLCQLFNCTHQRKICNGHTVRQIWPGLRVRLKH